MNHSFEKGASASKAGIWPLLAVAVPMMLSSLSGSLMLLADRVFLAHYSLHAFNAVVTISSVILMLQIGANACVAIADVFVGQLHGADNKQILSAPTWQMIWFSLLTFVIFLPIAFLSTFYMRELGYQEDAFFYSTFLIAICPLSPLQVALASFFVGRKQTITPFIGTLVGNLVNLTLNYLLIFGHKHLNIPALGMQGAAIATVLGQCTNVGVLTLAFFTKPNRIKYLTNKAQFDFALMFKILKIGFPNAVAQVMIASAWSCFFFLMNKLGEASMTMASFMQTLTGCFVFMTQGLSRAIISISANLIGEKRTDLISRTLLSGIKISIVFSLAIFIGFLLYPSKLLRVFFGETDFESASKYFASLQLALLWGWLAFLLKSIRALLSGLLTAAGNTRFVMWNESISIWLCFIIPIWICMEFFSFDVAWAYFLAFLYNLFAVFAYAVKLHATDFERKSRVI